jgi:streptogrisin C
VRSPRRSGRRLVARGVVGMLLLAMVAGEAVAAGADPQGAGGPPPYLADAADPAVTTMARKLGIPVRDAQRRIGWQEPALELAEELKQAMGDRYGDLWFDAAGGGRVKVGIVGHDTTLAAALIARRKLTAVTDLVPVRHSHAELMAAKAWLATAIVRANPPVTGGRLEGLRTELLPDKNVIKLSLPRGRALNAAQRAVVTEARRRLGGMLTVGAWAGRTRNFACLWTAGEFDCDPPLRGGVMMYSKDGNAMTPYCTVGFNARSLVDGKWYVMTAGHCGGVGRTFYLWQPRTRLYHVLGHMYNRVYSGPTGHDDFGIITVDNVPGWNPQPWVYVHLTDETTYNPTYNITGTGGNAKGMWICATGGVSGTDCNFVESVGIEPGGLAQVDLCMLPGDSGAPLFIGGKARGLLKGANGADNPGEDPPPCVDRLYQGITEAAQRLRVSVAHT